MLHDSHKKYIPLLLRKNENVAWNIQDNYIIRYEFYVLTRITMN